MSKYLGINPPRSDHVVKQVIEIQPKPTKPIVANWMKSNTADNKMKCIINIGVIQRASDSSRKAWAQVELNSVNI